MQSIAIRSAPESCLIALEWASSAVPDNWTHLHSWHRCIHPFYLFIYRLSNRICAFSFVRNRNALRIARSEAA